MANPIQPVGGNDIVESARQQDMERRQREAQDHYNRTGERLTEYQEYDPLVPINGYEPPDIAGDGDSYADTRGTYADTRGTYGDTRGTYGDDRTLSIGRALDDVFGGGYADSSRDSSEARQLREQALQAEDIRNRKEYQKKRDELRDLQEEAKKRFNNAVSGLEIDDEE